MQSIHDRLHFSLCEIDSYGQQLLLSAPVITGKCMHGFSASIRTMEVYKYMPLPIQRLCGQIAGIMLIILNNLIRIEALKPCISIARMQ